MILRSCTRDRPSDARLSSEIDTLVRRYTKFGKVNVLMSLMFAGVKHPIIILSRYEIMYVVGETEA